jgi:hypothetical protein
MTIWEVCHYVFPGDGIRTLERVLDDLPANARARMIGSFCPYSLLILRKADALCMMLIMHDEGVKLLADGILWVPDNAQTGCLQVVSERSMAVQKWCRFLEVEFGSAQAIAAFDALGTKHGFSRQI